ncbi:Ionotropic receptor 165 [Hyalella azteca]|uniref:Glutamate receptor ionotropic, kainate glr-3-like n=1 Tax=Hyalella azteca TaxID=294128 RepID=A0A6A0HBZ5_HYAAZ|nr:glutamate receptor ionotropic, kainate glr-3-like [Hyalella azteca]KAA0203293.1 Ionotropic receptor 165 [Hyalella azteca]
MRPWTIPHSPTGESFEAPSDTPGCISVAVFPTAPALVNLDTKPYSGAHVEVFRIIMHALKWCYNFVAVPDRTVGMETNGSYNGATGMVQRREVDMMLGPVSVYLYRSEVLDYAPAFFKIDNYYLYRRITSIQPDVLIFTKPFMFEVWVCVLLSVLIVGVVAGLLGLAVSRFIARGGHTTGRPGSVSKIDIGSRGFMWALQIFLSQDSKHSPGWKAGRTLGAFWLLVSFMIGAMYKCNLSAILINDKIKLPFSTDEEFVSQKDYKLTWIAGQIYGPYFEGIAKTEPKHVFGKLWALRDGNPPLTADVVDRVLNERVAAVVPSLWSKSFMADDFSKYGNCRLASVKSNLVPLYMTFGYPKNSPLKNAMDLMSLRVIETGLPDYLLKKKIWNSTWCTKTDNNLSESRALTVKDFLGIFLVYGIGVAVASVVFAVEVMTKRSARRQQ